jgi:hypothetical protein
LVNDVFFLTRIDKYIPYTHTYMSHLQTERKNRIETLVDVMHEYDTWESFSAYAFEHLFRLGLTSDKIESDYLTGLRVIYISNKDTRGTERHKPQ